MDMRPNEKAPTTLNAASGTDARVRVWDFVVHSINSTIRMPANTIHDAWHFPISLKMKIFGPNECAAGVSEIYEMVHHSTA